jgi:dTDP-4-dehydrorhamnose reductase
MKVVIIGAKGMLGQELVKVFADEDLLLLDKNELDITDAENVDRKIRLERPDLIVNSAAYNAVDDCETKFDLAKKINADGPMNLARAAKEVGARFVHYSTDYVFDGEKIGGYVESDAPAPISKYGESKSLGERVVDICDKCYLIRTSRLYGAPALSEGAKKSFVDVMLTLAESRPELNIVAEELSCPTYAVDLAVATKNLIDSQKDFGVYHFVNEGACTWCEFAEEIFNIVGKNVILIPVKSDHFPRPAKRPKYSRLLNTKFAPLRSWREALKDYLEGRQI